MKMSNNPAKYVVLIKQYLRSILDISVVVTVLPDLTPVENNMNSVHILMLKTLGRIIFSCERTGEKHAHSIYYSKLRS